MLCLGFFSSYIFLYIFLLFFGRIYREFENPQQYERKCKGEEKTKYTFKCEIYSMSFNNGHFSGSRLIGCPAVLVTSCRSQAAGHKHASPCEGHSSFPWYFLSAFNCVSVRLFNDKCPCYKENNIDTSMSVKGPTQLHFVLSLLGKYYGFKPSNNKMAYRMQYSLV